jgi:hypothetical protein
MRERGGVSVYDLAAAPAVSAPVSIEAGGTPACSAPQPLVLQRP